MNLRIIEKGIVIFAIIAGTILVLVSCSKNDNNEPVAPPTTQVETPEHLKGWTPQLLLPLSPLPLPVVSLPCTEKLGL